MTTEQKPLTQKSEQELKELIRQYDNQIALLLRQLGRGLKRKDVSK